MILLILVFFQKAVVIYLKKFFFFFWLICAAYGISVPQPGIKLSSLVLKAQSLTIGLAGKSWSYAFMCMGDFWNDMPETVNGGYM